MLCCRALKLEKTLALSHSGACLKRCPWERTQRLSCSTAHGIIQKGRWIGCNGQSLSLAAPKSNEMFQSPVVCHRRTLSLASCLSAAAVSTLHPGWYESFADSVPVHLTQDFLTNVQQATGLPWWASIICTTMALRVTVTLPLAVYQMYIIAKVENLQPEIAELAKRLRYEVSMRAKQVGWSEKVARFHFRKNLQRIISELYVRDNCHPFKASLLIWVQLPLWIFISVALRNLSLAASDTAADFCTPENRIVKISEIRHLHDSWNFSAHGSDCCNSALIYGSLLADLQLCGSWTEFAAAFPQASYFMPNTQDEVRLRYSLQRLVSRIHCKIFS
ncbi:cytochrome c oxidase assembly protein COX18, mitochondrial isoform X2 [Heterodontus francisci]|uniref:cytochrome c oxidase assembly protein COX18, mitochondrial isoform X2 n=1 Tax=Heterodontus francisci TaxID=7792 RepID=UPI00355C20BA